MATFNSTITDNGRLDRLLYLANANFYMAIGKSTPWDSTWGDNISDTNPPIPASTVTDVNTPLLYKLPYYQTLAVDSQCGDIPFTSCGSSINTPTQVTLIDLSATSSATLKQLSPNYLYVNVILTQDDIDLVNLTSFRIAGLYKDCVFTSTGQATYLPNQLTTDGVLYWISYFTPITSSAFIANMTSSFEILIKI